MSPRTDSRTAVACLGNALDLASAADLLETSGFGGPASAFYVLACEEIEKGGMYRSSAEGISSLDPRDIGKKWVFDPKHVTMHEMKHFTFAGAAMAPAILAHMESHGKEIEEAFEGLNLGPPFPEPGDLPPEVRKKLEVLIHADPALDAQMRELAAFCRRMGDIKARGFYVDHQDGTVVTPQGIAVDDLARLRRLFDQVRLGTTASLLGDVPLAATLWHRSFMARMAKYQKVPTGRKLRQGFFHRKLNREETTPRGSESKTLGT